MKRRFVMRLSVGNIMHDEIVEFDDSPSVVIGAKLENARLKVQKEYGRRAVVESVMEVNKMEKKEYIEREAVLTVIQNLFHDTSPVGEEQFGFLKAHRIVREAPSADVIPVVHGEWVYVDSRGRNAEYECSVCHEHVQFDEKIDGSIPRYKGCPHCLAKMDGGKE